MLPNYVAWFVGVDVEFVLSCCFNPLGRHSDESEQKTLDSVCGLDSKEDGHERQPGVQKLCKKYIPTDSASALDFNF